MTGSGRTERGWFCVPRRRNGFSISSDWFFPFFFFLFFFSFEHPDEKSRAQRWSMRSPIHTHTARGERTEKRDPYILDALSARNAATDLHQGNHDDTSYGKSLYTRAHSTRIRESRRVWGYIQRFIDEPLCIPPSSSLFLVGVRAKITAGKLGICLRYTGLLDICQEEEPAPGFLPPSVNLSGTYRREASLGSGRDFGNLWRKLLRGKVYPANIFVVVGYEWWMKNFVNLWKFSVFREISSIEYLIYNGKGKISIHRCVSTLINA